MRNFIILFLLFSFFCCASVQNQPCTPFEKALHALGESLVETCSICVQKLRKEAFTILNEEFPIGKTIGGNDISFKKSITHAQSLLVGGGDIRAKGKTDAGVDYELPLVIFRYHTADNYIAGITPADFTDAKTASLLKSLPYDKAFFGSIIAIPFRYGDGKTFSYSSKENILTVHCKVSSERAGK